MACVDAYRSDARVFLVSARRHNRIFLSVVSSSFNDDAVCRRGIDLFVGRQTSSLDNIRAAHHDDILDAARHIRFHHSALPAVIIAA